MAKAIENSLDVEARVSDERILKIFTLFKLVSAIIGTVVGGVCLFLLWGWLGLLGGILIGWICGWYSGPILIKLLILIPLMKERLQQHRDLQKYFGRYWTKARAKEWFQLEDTLLEDEPVSGPVVACYYYGVFIDTNHGFPALILTGDSDADIQIHQAQVGESLAAKVLSLNRTERYIELWHPKSL